MPLGIYIKTVEHRKKLGDALRGRPLTEQRKRNISNALKGCKGHPCSSKTRKAISLAQRKRKRSIEWRLMQSLRYRGEKSPLWKGGVCREHLKIRQSVEYKLWREAVFKRDNFTCIWCGAKNGNGKTVNLNADHIKPFCDYPELRFAIDNGRTLCINCHKKTETYGRGR
jgi:5-methylcytosine-specific restriction endonuclease McrA